MCENKIHRKGKLRQIKKRKEKRRWKWMKVMAKKRHSAKRRKRMRRLTKKTRRKEKMKVMIKRKLRRAEPAQMAKTTSTL